MTVLKHRVVCVVCHDRKNVGQKAFRVVGGWLCWWCRRDARLRDAASRPAPPHGSAAARPPAAQADDGGPRPAARSARSGDAGVAGAADDAGTMPAPARSMTVHDRAVWRVPPGWL